MSANKIVETDADVSAFLAAVEPARRREDGLALRELFGRITGLPAKMWGPSMVGYGSYHYRYDSGREGDAMLTGFSPRKANLSLYIMPGFNAYADLLARLGKHKHSVSCLYLNKLADIDLSVLEELIRRGFEDMKARYGA